MAGAGRTQTGMHIHSIPAGAPFADLLAQGLLAHFCPRPEDLADALVLLPTRRAARALREAFLRASGGRPLLLPRMEPIGDVDDDELLLEQDLDAELAPAIGAQRRLATLAQLLRAHPSTGGDPAMACRLAASLVSLLDSAALEEVSLDRLDGIVDADLASHWQASLDVLKVLREAWPGHLAELGLADRAARRIAALRARIAAWAAAPPTGLVVAAGSTGSIPATADLLATVATLPRGVVLLPGLDAGMDDESWAAAGEDPAHPQHGLARLLARLGVAREAVAPWPGAAPAHPRVALLREALRPAATTPAWAAMERPGPEAFEGLRRIEAPTQLEEALAIALVLREAVETPGRTAALVTPDRALARRVAAELARWGLGVDDSGGTDLLLTPPGAFLRATAALGADPGAPVELLSALKHPFACAGLPRGVLLSRVRRLERVALRGLRPGPGVEGLRKAVEASEVADRDEILAFVDLLSGPLAAFAAAMQSPAVAPARLCALHLGLMEWLATPAAPRESELWAGEAGSALRDAMMELQQALAAFDPIPGRSWPALLEAMLAGQVVRARYPTHPRLSIWGPLEARLQGADILVLGGLNEGSWPPEPPEDPWLSRPMRKAFGLPPAERRVGLSAHDFVQAAAAPVVLLSHSRKVDGAPVAPSRWLQRLEAFLGGHEPWTSCVDARLPGWVRALDAPERPSAPPTPPRPCPPVELRPVELPVTAVETLVRDPYAVYARRILNLRPLDDVDEEPSAGERGTVIHDALHDLLAAGGPLPGDALERLLAIGRTHFAPLMDRPVVRAVWWPRFARLARWFVDWERERRATGTRTLAVECRGELRLPSGFLLTAEADRIDALPDGTLGIVDYKTGTVPSYRQVEVGFSPQLPLEAAIAREGGFPGVAAAPPGELLHVRLTGGATPGEARRVQARRGSPGKSPDELARDALAGLERLVASYADPRRPYLARPRVRWKSAHAQYDHLARVAEWSALEAEGDK